MINYEEGAENNVLHGDAASESLLTEFGFATARAGQRYLPVESMYEYGSRVGFWRLHRLFRSGGSRSPSSASRWRSSGTPTAVAAMREAGWDDREPRLPLDRPPRHARGRGARAHPPRRRDPRARGRARPLGHFLGRRSENTVRLVAEEGGFLYSQDSYADELPYWVVESGRPLLLVPYTADVNDHRFTTVARLRLGRRLLRVRCATPSTCSTRRGSGPPRMMSIGLHCRLVGRPGRFRALERLVEHVQAHDRVWLCRGVDIAEHWRARFPPP